MGSRRIEVEIIGDARGFGRAAAEAEARSQKLGRSLKRLAGFAAAGGGVALLAEGFRRSVNAASDLNEQVNKTAAVFGKAGSEVVKWSESSADAFGMSQRQALEATGTFGNMLVPMGLARGEAAKMSQRFVGLAADMASFNNASPQETLDALRAGLAGESEPLRRFGVFLNEARVKQEAMNLGLTDGKKALTEAQKAQARYSLILKDSKDAQGDFARTSDSLANRTRTAKANIEDAAAVLGEVFLPYVASAMGKVSEFAKGMQTWIPSAVDAVQSAFGKLSSMADPFVDVVQWVARTDVALDAVVSVVAGLTAAWVANKVAVQAAAFATKGFAAVSAAAGMIRLAWATRQAGGAMVLLRAAMAATPIGALATVIGAAVGAATMLFGVFRRAPSASEVQRRALDDVRESANRMVDALNGARGAAESLQDSQLEVASAALDLRAAEARAAEAVRDYGAGSDEAKRAAIELEGAKNRVTRANKDLAGAEATVADRMAKTASEWVNHQQANERGRNALLGQISVTKQFAAAIPNADAKLAELNSKLGELNKVASQSPAKLKALQVEALAAARTFDGDTTPAGKRTKAMLEAIGNTDPKDLPRVIKSIEDGTFKAEQKAKRGADKIKSRLENINPAVNLGGWLAEIKRFMDAAVGSAVAAGAAIGVALAVGRSSAASASTNSMGGVSSPKITSSAVGLSAPTGRFAKTQSVVNVTVNEAQHMDSQELSRHLSWQFRRVSAGGVA